MSRKAVRPVTEQPQDDSYRVIPLTQGKQAIVDVQHFEGLMRHSWFAWRAPRKGSFYACRTALVNGKKQRIYMHRQILGLEAGDPRQVDHAGITNTLDNRLSNIRIASRSQNQRNRRKWGKCPYRGVTWDNAKRKWLVQIRMGGKHIYAGRFDNPEDAARAYDVLVLQRDGEFAFLNFPA